MADKRKTTTKQHFEVLVSLIERNGSVAGDRDKGSNKFWHEVATNLHDLGPPINDVSGWKKVWADYKSGLKKKLAHNRSEYRATGGGP
ncbi:uncharacterized protein LOC118514237 [Anopheles stephensi]|uniref:uncharacterized protein LOC118514237 n=1 Tax=Anopheles stephensi TaxID=30069 RepID=UPI001658A609|nr:uncharacterized protein LOC118514237 [Anopheles stephensi]